MKWTVLLLICASLTACAHYHQEREETTPECMTYQHMMAAPISPDAMMRLQDKCVASQKRTQ